MQPRRRTPLARIVSITPTGNFGANYSFDYGLKRGTGGGEGEGEGCDGENGGSFAEAFKLTSESFALPRRRS